MTRKPLFWCLLLLASCLSLLFSQQWFTRAFPAINLSVSMSRDGALQAAQAKARALNLAASDARSTVRFYHHDQVQTFIELEAGGETMLQRLQQDKVASLWQWEVRFYKEHDAAYSTVFFSPDGKALGFARHVPENQAGAALSEREARALAEDKVRQDWQIDLRHGPYVLVSQSTKTRPNGRIDHSLVYERPDLHLGKAGEGRVQLDVALAGNVLSQVQPHIKVPESFERRYKEMRAANEQIASVDSIVILLAYGLLGCVVGLLLLWRDRWLIYRPALLWAGFIALLQLAASVNAIPGSWFEYDSAISTGDFIAQQIAVAVVGSCFTALILFLSFMAAEGLGRKAFGHQVQFWRAWSGQALSSKTILGQTVAGYLWVGFDLAFIVGFYYVTRHYLGWWSPLDTMTDPNILATPMPWLTPLSNALHAGFWEECLFRAVPLAGSALIGDFLQDRYHGRFGGRRLWLLIGLVAQAIIFGCGHANYAQQPAYARPVELFFPALIWGLVYLRFGLLPGIIFHFVFDLTLMSLPIFLTQASGLEPDRAIVILAGLAPLLLVLWQRWRSKRWQELPVELYNHAWQAPPPSIIEPSSHQPAFSWQADPWDKLRRWLPLMGLLALLTWQALPPDAPKRLPFELERTHAEASADAALHQRGVVLGPNWHRFSRLRNELGEGSDFIWKKAGKAAWQALYGHYIPPATWEIRYVHFDGAVEARAEEWIVHVESGIDGQGGDAHVRGVVHRLPEAHAGASLSQQEARSVAQQALRHRFGPGAGRWREISAQETKLPQRKNWQFTFADDPVSPLKTGEARIDVLLAGKEVTQIRRYIQAPEDWEREQRAKEPAMNLARLVAGVLAAALCIGSLILAIRQKSGVHLPLRPALWVGLGVFILIMLGHANDWQNIAMQLKTEQPIEPQLAILTVVFTIIALLYATLVALLLHFTRQGAAAGKLGPRASLTHYWVRGASLALLAIGVFSACSHFLPADSASLPSLDNLNHQIPLFAEFSTGIVRIMLWGNVVGFALIQLHDFNHNFQRHQLLTILILLVLGLVSAIGQSELARFLLQGFGVGLGLALIYLTVARFEPKVLFAALASLFVLINLQRGWHAPYADALLFAGVQSAVMLVVAHLWLRSLVTRSPGT